MDLKLTCMSGHNFLALLLGPSGTHRFTCTVVAMVLPPSHWCNFKSPGGPELTLGVQFSMGLTKP